MDEVEQPNQLSHIGHFYQEEPIVQDALRNLDIREDITVVLALELLQEYRTGLRKVIESDPRTQEVRTTIQALKSRGKRLGVFSNDRTVALGFILNIMGVRPCFEYVETSESIGIEKPDPRVFDHILNFFGTEPAGVVYVGDDPVRDIAAAKGRGLRAVRYRVNEGMYHQSWRDYTASAGWEADASIGRFSELLDIIE